MIPKSALVYNLLRVEKRADGFSPNEICNRVSEMHNITPGKGLKRQVNVALRRGVDFGILVRRYNKYLYDPNIPTNSIEQPADRVRRRRRRRRRRAKTRARSRRTRSKPVRKPKASSNSTKPQPNKRTSIQNPARRKQYREPPPKPRVPPPPNWTPKRRNIREEQMPKHIRHPHNPPDPL